MKNIASLIPAAAISMAAAALCVLPSCKGKTTDNADSTINTAEVAAPADTIPLLISDSLAQTYNKAFFDNKERMSSEPSDSTWMQTNSGLKYTIVREGSGKQPTAEDAVTVHYIGRMTDGTVFDSSISHGQAISFPLSGVIPGWTEGLQLMKEGGVCVFYIPSDIAYGERGGGPIPPNSDLIFDVQLISVGGPAYQ